MHLISVPISALSLLIPVLLREHDYITSGSFLSQIRLSSVTYVRPTQWVETFGNISSPKFPLLKQREFGRRNIAKSLYKICQKQQKQKIFRAEHV